MNARNIPNTAFRWNTPSDWSLAWNYRRAALIGMVTGVSSTCYFHVREPVLDLLHFYQGPSNLAQLKIYCKEVLKSESFRSGLMSRFLFECTRGLCFETARYGIYKSMAGGFWAVPEGIDIYHHKVFLTALITGATTSWIPVIFYNWDLRFKQDAIFPTELRRGYGSHVSALAQIISKDGAYPLFRSAGPMMAEYCMQTTFMFTMMDFWKDKTRHLEWMGNAYPAYNSSILKFFNVAASVYMGFLFSKPFHHLRVLVENVPQNSRGERMFTSYSEAFGKFAGEYYFLIQLY